jgi:G:T/U-mismatch repair DNA glycosylase
MLQEEIHPWNCYAPAKSKILIVGTFPTARRNWKFDFFYPNPANLFWRVMAKISNTELYYFSGNEAVLERKKILQKLNIAITDMGKKVIRNDDSSLDEQLIPLEYIDIFQILDDNPGISKIIFTSSSGRVSASKWFTNYLKIKNFYYKFPKGAKPLQSEIKFKNKTIHLAILYSPSRRAANRITFEKLVDIYKNEIT